MKSLKIALPILITAASFPVAAATDYSTMIISFNVGDIITALMSVGAILASIYAIRKGIYMILKAVTYHPPYTGD